MAKSLQGLIVQIDMGDVDEVWIQAVGIHCEAVILGRDFDPPGRHVFHRLIGAPMTEFEFVGAPPQGQPQKLMAEAYTEQGAVCQQIPDRVDGRLERFGITGAVGQKDTVRPHASDRIGPRAGGHHHDVASDPLQVAQDIVLDAEIEGNDPLAPAPGRPNGFIEAATFGIDRRRSVVAPAIGSGRRYLVCEIAAGHDGHAPRLSNQGRRIQFGRGNPGTHGARLADMAGQRPGVEGLDAENLVLMKVFGQAGTRPEIARKRLIFPDQQGGYLDSVGLHIFRIDPVIADQRIGHGYHLTAVGGIGQDFLVSGHTGIEYDLAPDLTGAGKRTAVKHASVFEC